MNESVSQIYVVDDDVSVREGVGRLIRSAGLNVKTFPTAQEIIASLQQELPSCLVLDVQLPDINGFELQQQLAKKDLQVPIIFLTGYGDIPQSVRAMKAGAIEFLTKPFRDEELLNLLIKRLNVAPRSNGLKMRQLESTRSPKTNCAAKPVSRRSWGRVRRCVKCCGRSTSWRRVMQAS